MIYNDFIQEFKSNSVEAEDLTRVHVTQEIVEDTHDRSRASDYLRFMEYVKELEKDEEFMAQVKQEEDKHGTYKYSFMFINNYSYMSMNMLFYIDFTFTFLFSLIIYLVINCFSNNGIVYCVFVN